MLLAEYAEFQARASGSANDRAGGLTRYERDVISLANTLGSTDVGDHTLLVARAWANSFRAIKTASGNRLSSSSDVVVQKIAAELKLPLGTIRVAMQRYADAIRRSNSCRPPDQNRTRATVNGDVVRFELDQNR